MRLFVAAWPDDATRRRLDALQLELGRTKGLRFVGATRWHVTLRFLGEVAADAVGPVGEAVTECAARLEGPVECRLGPGTGWFTGVRVLQLPAAGLDGVARAVRAATLALVPEPEGGEPPFNGHLTLARSKGRRLSVAALGEMSGIPFEATFAVAHIDLVASEPSSRGHGYTTVVRARLGAPSGSTASPAGPSGTR